MASATSALNKDIAAGDSSERILFCTPQGLKWISLDSLNLETDSEISETNTVHDCPFCASDEYFIDDALINTALSTTLNPCSSYKNRTDLISFKLPEFYIFSSRAVRAPPAFS